MIEYYKIGLIALLGAMSPGPDFVIVAKNALTYNRKSGILSSLGIGIGVIIHSSYCILGLALAITHSLLLFSLIKYLGAAYLIFLGTKSLFSNTGHLPIAKRKTMYRSGWRSFREGLLTNVLNPKCTLFMLSVFTLVVKPNTPPFTQAMYGLEIALISSLWFITLSYVLTTFSAKSPIEKMQHIVTRLMGGALILFGVLLAFQ